jgi:hypothetical protein
MNNKKKTNIVKEIKEVDSEIEVPFLCPTCQKTEYEVVGELPSQIYSGVKNGETFNSIERSIVKCQCGQHSVLTQYIK